MNKNKIKTFAVWARQDLHQQVETKMATFGITRKKIETPTQVQNGFLVGGKLLNLTPQEMAQYSSLVEHLKTVSFDHAVSEIAYTWFNRFAALRYLEVNGLEEHTLSSGSGSVNPDLLEHAETVIASGKLPGITPEQYLQWRSEQGDEVTYQRLLSAFVRHLSTPLPYLFESKEHPYLELFMPANLLHTESILRKIVQDIPKEDWQDIEIIGWLYQFYISERKAQVFAAKSKVEAEDIPAATQLFTPHWIVRYMVENSLGRLWLEHHPESQLRSVMPYFLENPEQPLDVRTEVLTPQELRVLDPACGSGHILVYAFDLLFEIYKEQGYSERDIPKMVLEHNLFGLDIDERAAQLASFALVMKATQKNRRILRNSPQVNILQVKPTRFSPLFGAQAPTRSTVQGALGFGSTPQKDQSLFSEAINPKDWQPLLYAFKDADSLGSLITSPEDVNYGLLNEQVQRLEQEGGLGAERLTEKMRRRPQG